MPVIGIDLGTTTSAVATVDESGGARVIESSEGTLSTPSVVFFRSPNVQVVGAEALAARAGNPNLVVETVKHFMGHDAEYEFHDQKFTPELISAIILRKLVQDATRKLGEPAAAVISVPAIFGDGERNATRVAAEIANLDLLGIIDEPVAAALAYCESKPDGVYLVFDLGGGTFDVSVVRKANDMFEMLATDGDRRLGGKDWDQEIAQAFGETFKAAHGVDPMRSPQGRVQLMALAETAKIQLTEHKSAEYRIEHGGRTLRGSISRSEFEEMTKPLLDQTEATVMHVIAALKSTGKLANGFRDIDQVLVAGGSSRMPMVVSMLQKLTDRTPCMDDVDYVVAKGAAIYANLLLDSDKTSRERTQKGFPRGNSVTVRRVSSFSLGIEVWDPSIREVRLDIVVPKNSQIPCSQSRSYGTSVDNQEEVEIELMECDGQDLGRAVRIGTGVLTLPSGLPSGSRVEITLGLDEEGCIDVTASASGRQVSFRVVREGIIQQEEIEAARKRLVALTIT